MDTYCFCWKSEIFLSAKPEVELILTIVPMEKNIFNVKYFENGEYTLLDSKEVRQETTHELLIGTMTFDPLSPLTILDHGH